MSIKQQVIRIAAEKGIAVEVGGGRWFTVELVAPDGRFFVSHGVHVLVSEGDRSAGNVSANAWAMALADVKNAVLEDCPADCDCKNVQ